MPNKALSARGQQLLKVLVERYIREGQPVGSKVLLEEAGLPVSTATVRNIMSDLEDSGYIVSPHTSSGRIPTARGYRLFVDSLITMQPLEGLDLQSLREEMDPDKSARELVESTSNLLSAITRQAGLVTLPRADTAVLRQVEFLPLSGQRVLVILVTNEQEVQNRIIHTDREYGEIELRQVTNFINEKFVGKGLEIVRAELLQEMQTDKDRIGVLLQSSIDIASQAFADETDTNDYVLAGQGRLLDTAGPEGMSRLRELFDAFQYKKDILHLMDRCIQADGVHIFIGEESGYDMLDGFSVITAPYQSGVDTIGVLGVIGPTRMAYERVIPIVDITAKMLSVAFK